MRLAPLLDGRTVTTFSSRQLQHEQNYVSQHDAKSMTQHRLTSQPHRISAKSWKLKYISAIFFIFNISFVTPNGTKIKFLSDIVTLQHMVQNSQYGARWGKHLPSYQQHECVKSFESNTFTTNIMNLEENRSVHGKNKVKPLRPRIII